MTPKIDTHTPPTWAQVENNGRAIPWGSLEQWQKDQIRTQFPSINEVQLYEKYWSSLNHCMLCGARLVQKDKWTRSCVEHQVKQHRKGTPTRRVRSAWFRTS